MQDEPVAPSVSGVKVANSGAFQRLVDEEMHKALVTKYGTTDSEGMAHLPLDALPACYQFVAVHVEDGRPSLDAGGWSRVKELRGRCVAGALKCLCPSCVAAVS